MTTIFIYAKVVLKIGQMEKFKKYKYKLLDDFYVFDEKNPDLNKYIKNTKEIKNILITIRTLQSRKKSGSG